MSYTDNKAEDKLASIENKFSDYPEYDDVALKVSQGLFKINGGISTLQQFVETLEDYNRNDKKTKNLNTKIIEKITKKSVSNIEKVTQKLFQINTLVHSLNSYEKDSLDTQRLISREKLLRDVSYALQEFQNCQTRLKTLTQQANNEAKTALLQEEHDHQTARDTEEMSDQTTQKQTMVIEREDLNNEELVYHQNLIRERDEEITNIQNGITELNSIFQDLNGMVVEQGQLVDNIESNIYSVETDTQAASKQLRRAMISQKRKSKLYIYLFVVLMVILFFTILVM